MRVERRLSMLLAVACGVSVANVYYAQPLLGRIGAGLHVGAAQLGLVTTVTQAGYLLGLILIVPLGDLTDRRRLIVTQAVVAAAALITAGFATDTAVFFAASAVVGLVCVVVQVIVAYAAASSRIIGSYMTFYSVGTGGGAIAATTLYSLAGWGAVSALGAGLSVMALLVWAADRLLSPGGTTPRDAHARHIVKQQGSHP